MKKGDWVRLVHTGETGIIIRDAGSGVVVVHLDEEDWELPVDIDALMPAQLPYFAPKEIQSDPFAETPQKPAPKKRPATPSETLEDPYAAEAYELQSESGIHLAFDAQLNADGDLTHYDLIVLNVTFSPVALEVLTGNGKMLWNGIAREKAPTLIGKIPFEGIQDGIDYRLEASRLTTAGPEPFEGIHLKKRLKALVKKVGTAPFLNRPTLLFSLFPPIPELQSKKTNREEDLFSYTKRNSADQEARKSKYVRYSTPSVMEVASFPRDIDLHAEQLVDKVDRLNPSEILRLQIIHFDRYIERAVLLGVDRVFVIHGIGRGKLRTYLAGRLRENPYVIDFKNEYHHKYGWGATEVIF